MESVCQLTTSAEAMTKSELALSAIKAITSKGWSALPMKLSAPPTWAVRLGTGIIRFAYNALLDGSSTPMESACQLTTSVPHITKKELVLIATKAIISKMEPVLETKSSAPPTWAARLGTGTIRFAYNAPLHRR